MNLKENIYLYVNSTTQRCPNKTIKTVMIEDFSIWACVNDSGGAPWAANTVSPQIGEKMCYDSNRILRGLGETDSCKNLKSKISWLCPFKVIMRGVDKKFQNQSHASFAVESC